MRRFFFLLINLFFTTTLFAQGVPFTTSSSIPKTDITTGMYPHSLVPADFNGDGKTDPDIVVTNSNDLNSVSVYQNNSSWVLKSACWKPEKDSRRQLHYIKRTDTK